MRKRLAFLACLVAGFLIVGTLLCQVASPPAVAAIPTPVGQQAGGGDWVMTTYTSASSWNNFTTTQTSPSQHAPAYTAADITWTIDVSGTVNVTCTLQFSNDDTNWASGVNILNGVSADETNTDQFELFGRWHRIVCAEDTAGYPNTVTVTLMSKLMN